MPGSSQERIGRRVWSAGMGATGAPPFGARRKDVRMVDAESNGTVESGGCRFREVTVADTPGSIGGLGRAGSGGAWRSVMFSIAVAVFARPVPSASASAPAMPLQPMTLAQVMRAGAAGTGCSWSPSGSRRMLFAAADDRAVIRIHGRLVALQPRSGAEGLFPSTFAAWQAKGVKLEIEQLGRSRRYGTEATSAKAVLALAVNAKSYQMIGVLSCGS